MGRVRLFFGRIFSKTIQVLFPSWREQLKRELAGYNSVLDLGCGWRSAIEDCNIPYSVGVDLYESYLEQSKKLGIHSKYIKGNILKLDYEPKSFDAVIALAVIEHMTKENGYTLVEKMERWARKKIIITTTNGYLPQDEVDGNPLQVHKSGWSLKELRDLGFKVYGKFGWIKLRGYVGRVKYRPAILWHCISGVTQYFTGPFPKWAFIFFATKKVEDK